MGRKQKTITGQIRYDLNRVSFIAIQNEWATVRLGYLRSLSAEAKAEVERIYREELNQNWLPNTYCSGCYFKAIQELIHHFVL